VDEAWDRSDGHHQSAGDHDPRRAEVVGEPPTEWAPGGARQCRRSDGESDEYRATAE
jgi:hypothetical protein